MAWKELIMMHLATLTILVASSRPEDKEIMMQLIKTIIK